ncbi:MAG: hypothetical protein ACTSYG_07610 [Candidatus Heimdallarchaeota archaeon]
MELKVKENKKLSDGVHKGVIVEIQYISDPYEYADIIISYNEEGSTIKAGFPSNLTVDSYFYEVLSKFEVLSVGDVVDPEKILIGKKVLFQTITKKKDGKEYTNIVRESVKPVEELIK